jgi:hypothetical protein
MSKTPSFRDIKQLSAYLDGELSASASRKMKSRLARDPNLLAALDDLRDTRAILRRIPSRRVPRNFTLSPQIAAKRPPIPRLVPALTYATALAMLLFFISFLPPIGFGAAGAPAPEMAMEYAAEEESAAEEAPAAEAPLAEEALVAEEPAEEVPAVEDAIEEAPALTAVADGAAPDAEGEMLDATLTPTAEYSSTPRIESETEKVAADQEADNPLVPTLQSTETFTPTVGESPDFQRKPIFSPWQKMLLVAIIFLPLIAFILRRVIIAKWQKASK